MWNQGYDNVNTTACGEANILLVAQQIPALRARMEVMGLLPPPVPTPAQAETEMDPVIEFDPFDEEFFGAVLKDTEADTARRAAIPLTVTAPQAAALSVAEVADVLSDAIVDAECEELPYSEASATAVTVTELSGDVVAAIDHDIDDVEWEDTTLGGAVQDRVVGDGDTIWTGLDQQPATVHIPEHLLKPQPETVVALPEIDFVSAGFGDQTIDFSWYEQQRAA